MRDWPDGSVTIAFRETCEEAQTFSWGDTNEQRPTQTPSIPFFRTLQQILQHIAQDFLAAGDAVFLGRARTICRSPGV